MNIDTTITPVTKAGRLAKWKVVSHSASIGRLLLFRAYPNGV